MTKWFIRHYKQRNGARHPRYEGMDYEVLMVNMDCPTRKELLQIVKQMIIVERINDKRLNRIPRAEECIDDLKDAINKGREEDIENEI